MKPVAPASRIFMRGVRAQANDVPRPQGMRIAGAGPHGSNNEDSRVVVPFTDSRR
jgi:hypothetical protein